MITIQEFNEMTDFERSQVPMAVKLELLSNKIDEAYEVETVADLTDDEFREALHPRLFNESDDEYDLRMSRLYKATKDSKKYQVIPNR